MTTAIPDKKMTKNRSVKQIISKHITDLDDPERLIDFLETMPRDQLDDPGNFLGFIYQQSIDHRRC